MNKNSSLVQLSPALVQKINQEAPHLAKFFYINSKKKVSYYRKSSFNSHMDVYNAGSKKWEYAAAMTEDRLRHLPALSLEDYESNYENDDPSISEVLSLGCVAKAEAYAGLDNTSNIEADVVVTNILCNTTQDEVIPITPRRVKVQLPIVEPKKEKEESTISSKQIDQKKLFTLFKENLPEGFLLKFTPKELNYYVSYSHASQTWTRESNGQIQTIGTIYTNSLSCINAVVALLNDNEYTL